MSAVLRSCCAPSERASPQADRNQASLQYGRRSAQCWAPKLAINSLCFNQDVRRVPCSAGSRETLGLGLQPFSRGPLSSVDSGACIADPPQDIENFEIFDSICDDFSGPDASCDREESVNRDDEDSYNLDLDSQEPDSFTVPATLSDLDPLRQELAVSDRRARSAARCLKSMAWLAKVLPRSELLKLHEDPLMQDVVSIMDAGMYQFTAKYLVSCLWSMAYLQFVPGSVMTKLTRAVEAYVDDFDALQLVNIMWSFGKLNINPGTELVHRICDRLALLLVDLSPQGLSNVAWACARMQLRMPLLDAIAAESVSRLDSFTSQGVANLCWALAKVKHSTDRSALEAFEQHAITNFPEYSSQGSSLLLWGLAQQRYVPKRLLKLVGAELQSCCGQFSPDSLAAVMGAFATIDHRDEATLMAIQDQITDNLDQFKRKPFLLCSILWGVAMLGSPRAMSFAHRVMPIITKNTKTLRAAHLSNLLYALGKLKIRTGGVFPLQLVQRYVSEAPYMNSKQLATATTGLAEWPLTRDLVSRSLKVSREALVDCIRHKEITTQEVLQVITALHKRRMTRQSDIHLCYTFILAQLRNNSYTVIDVAQLATVLGRQQQPFPAPSTVSPDGKTENTESAGGNGSMSRTAGTYNDIGIGTAVLQLVQEIEELSCVHMRDGTLAPRQLACILWMFGRLGIQPSLSEFRGLICVFIRERVDECNAIDMANMMYSFVAMEYDPGLLVLDSMAWHVNNRYHEYGPVEMAQVLYGFAQMDFHPGTVFGRVAVVYAKNPGAFDRASLRLMKFAVAVFQDKADGIRAEDARKKKLKQSRGKRKQFAEASGNRGGPIDSKMKAQLGMK